MTKISKEDHEFWLLFNKGTKSLKKDSKIPYCAQKHSDTLSAWEINIKHFPFGHSSNLSSYRSSCHGSFQTSPPSLLQELDTIKKLELEVYPRRQRRKIIPIARLDLHGYTRAQADQLILAFLQKYYADSRNSIDKSALQSLKSSKPSKSLQSNDPIWVQIITGKSGILFSYVPEFLKKQSHLVSGYIYARDNDGGRGALYVRLRRRPFL